VDTVRVMIVDDHLVVREGLKQLLEIGNEIEVVAEASSGLECLQIIGELVPDIVFMDISMPGISGIEITRLLTEKLPSVKIIILTIYDDDQYVTEAIKAGAKAYLLKNTTRKQLMEVVRHVLRGRAFLDPNVTTGVFGELKRGSHTLSQEEKAFLTTRELEIIKAIVDGLKDKDIADTLSISEHTVRSHVKSIFRKLKVSSRSQAVTKAFEQGLVSYQSGRKHLNSDV